MAFRSEADKRRNFYILYGQADLPEAKMRCQARHEIFSLMNTEGKS